MEEQKEIIAVAQFMGAKLTASGHLEALPEWGTHRNMISAEDLKYDSSWDWLMPVIEKIKTINLVSSVTIDSRCGVKVAKGEYYMENRCDFKLWHIAWNPSTIHIGVCSEEDHLTVCYKAVLKFLKWYEENKDKLV